MGPTLALLILSLGRLANNSLSGTIFMKTAIKEELLAIHILCFLNTGCYDWIMHIQNGAPTKRKKQTNKETNLQFCTV
jgi:hypothetical protein